MYNQRTTPFSVTIITIFVLSITSWNLIRAYSVIVNWQVLVEYQVNPAYILGTAVFWATTGGWLVKIIYQRRNYALRANLTTAGLYYLWYWADRLFIQPSPAPNHTFSLVFSTITLLIFCILVITPSARSFLGKERA